MQALRAAALAIIQIMIPLGWLAFRLAKLLVCKRGCWTPFDAVFRIRPGLKLLSVRPSDDGMLV